MDTHATAAPRQSGSVPARRRHWGLVLLFTIAAVLLAGCGARIDTVLALNSDGSGVRTIEATIDADDLEKHFEGSADGIEEVITSTIPEGMTYEGSDSNAEGDVTFTFTIEFDDADDYEQKVTAILGSGGLVSLEADPVIEVHSDTFQTGIRVDENFTSKDLLQWLAQGLIDEGLVESSNRNNLMEFGDTVLEYADTQYSTSSAISFDEVQDFRFRAVSVTTSGIGSDALTRTVQYDLAREAYAQNPEGFDEFFAEATPPDAVFTPASGADSIWSLTFTVESPEQLIEYTNQALFSTESDFAVSQSAAEAEATLLTSVVDFVECASICRDDATLDLVLQVPTEWEGPGSLLGEAEGLASWSLPNSRDAVTFRHRIPFQAVALHTQVRESGEMHLAVDYTIEATYAELVGGALETMLRPADTVGTLESSDGDDTVVYTVTIGGSDSDEFTHKLAQFWPDSYGYVDSSGSGLFSRNYSLTLLFEVPSEQLAGGVINGFEHTIEFVDGAKPDTASVLPAGASVDGSTITFSQASNETVQLYVQASGTKWVPILLIAGVVLAVVGGFVVAFLRANRKPGATA